MKMIRAILAVAALIIPGLAHAQTFEQFNTYVLGLPAASTVNPNDVFYLNQGGVSKAVTGTIVAATATLPTVGVGQILANYTSSVARPTASNWMSAANGCPASALSPYQLTVDATGAPTNTLLTIYDASQCVTLGSLNSVPHIFYFFIGTKPPQVTSSQWGAVNGALTVSSAPSYTFPEAISTEFQGDFSHVYTAEQYTVTGAATMGNGTNYWSPAVTPHQSQVNYSSGVNTSTTDNGGRSGFAYYRVQNVHNGQGDLGAFYSYCEVDSTRAGATSWLASPACLVMGADLNARAAGAYLQGIGDLNFIDNGNDAAAIGDVRNMTRTVNTAAIGQIWAGYYLKSLGSKAIDALMVISGPSVVGLDTVLDTTTNLPAVNMAAGQRIVFNSTSTTMAGINWYGNVIGGTWIEHDTTNSQLSIAYAGRGLGFGVSAQAASVNWLQALGTATGTSPALQPQGGDTNIGIGYSTKGTGCHIFYTTSFSTAVAEFCGGAVNLFQATMIGASGTPDALLTVNYNSATPAGSLPSGNISHLIGATSTVARYLTDSFGSNGSFSCRQAHGTLASPTATAANDLLCSFNASGYANGAYVNAGAASIDITALNNWTSGDHSTYMAFKTTPSGSTTLTERMRIFASGGVSIGNTTDPGATNLDVSGVGRFGGVTSPSAGVGLELGYGAVANFSTITSFDRGGAVYKGLILNALSFNFEGSGASVADYGLTTASTWSFHGTGGVVIDTATGTLLLASSANTGSFNQISVRNSGTGSTSNTLAAFHAELSSIGFGYVNLAALGGGSPSGIVESASGLTGGLNIKSDAGPIIINAFTTLQFQSNGAGIGDYGLTTPSTWSWIAASRFLASVTVAYSGVVVTNINSTNSTSAEYDISMTGTKIASYYADTTQVILASVTAVPLHLRVNNTVDSLTITSTGPITLFNQTTSTTGITYGVCAAANANNATGGSLILDTSATVCSLSSMLFKRDIAAFSEAGQVRLASLAPKGYEKNLASHVASDVNPLSMVMRMVPAQYRGDGGRIPDTNLQLGLVAQDACDIDSRICARFDDGSPRAPRPQAVDALLVGAVQAIVGACDAAAANDNFCVELKRRIAR